MKPNHTYGLEWCCAVLKRIGRLASGAALSAALLVATGCGLTTQQKAGALKFSAATSTFSQLAIQEFVHSRDDVIGMNTMRVRLNDATLDVDAPLDTPLTAERVQARVEAVQVLQHYGEMIETLITSSNPEEIQNATDGFVTSLRQVKRIQLSDEKAGAIGSGVQFLGGLLVEHMRAKATRRAVDTAHPHIRTILELVKRDFDPEDEHWSLGYDFVAESLVGAAADVQAGLTTTNLLEGAVLREAKVTAAENKRRFHEISRQILSSLAELEKAQDNFRAAMQASGVTVERVDEWNAHVHRVASLYQVLRSKKPN